jgi:hypothetical protein
MPKNRPGFWILHSWVAAVLPGCSLPSATGHRRAAFYADRRLPSIANCLLVDWAGIAYNHRGMNVGLKEGCDQGI